MKRTLYLVIALFAFTFSSFADITDGYYYIVSAGNGPGYSGGPYNYENKVAMYNENGLVRWEIFDETNTKFVYKFTKDKNNASSWFLKNIADNTYIGTNYSTGTAYNGGIYAGSVETTAKPENSKTFTIVTPNKYFISCAGNKYALSMDNSHNGSPQNSGQLGVWGSLSSAQKYGINVWYIKPVPESILEKLTILPDSDFIDDPIIEPDTIIPDTIKPAAGLSGVLMTSGEFSSSTYKALNAFDGNLSTTFKAASKNNGWIGLDLGEKHVIEKIGFAPPASNAGHLLLGVFEGANKPDFSDAIPFHIIKETPKAGRINYADIECSKGFRYVRYVGPEKYLSSLQASYTYSEIAELQVFGTPGEGDDSQLYQFTNLPLVVFHTEKEMADIPASEKDIWRPGQITVISDNGTEVKSDSMNIKGRGNGSWSLVSSNNAKRPYKFKMASKHKLLGMPSKAKKWTLIANWGDKTILRNNVAFNISKLFEMDYTPAIRQVDVVFNGQYKGNYQLCDQIEVHKNRVELSDTTSNTQLLEPDECGYLIELDYYASGEPKWFRSNTYNIPVTVHYPEDDRITAGQFSYIQQAFNNLCTRVNSSLHKDETYGYAPVLATDTWLKYFLIEELCGNPDAYFSMYLTKEKGSDSKFRVCPVWDFDLAFDNDGRFHSIINDDYLCYSSRTYAAGSLKNMNQKIVAHNKELLSEIWSWYRYEGNLNNDYIHELVDSLYETNCESAKYNYIRWDILNTRTQQQYIARGTYKAEVDYILEYLFDRIAWMDNKVGLKEPIGIHSTADNTPKGGIHAGENHIIVRGFAEGSTVKIYNTSGNVVLTSEITDFDNQFALPKGIYIVSVTDGNGSTTTQKVGVK